jgi:hypothetical protein
MRNIVFGLLILFTACHSKNKEISYQIIPEDKFVKLLIDYHLASGIANSSLFRSEFKGCNKVTLSDSVLKNFGYTKAVFDSSVSYYASEPERYDAIYDRVVTELSRMQAEVEQKIAKEKDIKNKFEIKKRLVKNNYFPGLGKLIGDSLQNCHFNKIWFERVNNFEISDTMGCLAKIKLP